MAVSALDIKKLRDMTGISMGKCKEALEAANGDIEKALDILRKQGEANAAKRADRSTGEGVIISYVHNGRIGVLLKLGCETDFVARNEDFVELARDIAMHIAATNPFYISPEDVDPVALEKEKAFFIEQMASENKPADIKERILEGKLKKYTEENALLTQAFVRNPDITIDGLIKNMITKMGEKISVIEFKRMSI